MSRSFCRLCGHEYTGTHACNGTGNWGLIDMRDVDILRARIKKLEGVIAAYNDRLLKAGEKVGINLGCDTADYMTDIDYMADIILALRTRINELEQDWIQRDTYTFFPRPPCEVRYDAYGNPTHYRQFLPESKPRTKEDK